MSYEVDCVPTNDENILDDEKKLIDEIIRDVSFAPQPRVINYNKILTQMVSGGYNTKDCELSLPNGDVEQGDLIECLNRYMKQDRTDLQHVLIFNDNRCIQLMPIVEAG